MNKILVLLGIIAGLLDVRNSLADVTITEPLGGNDVSADKCVNSTNGASYTALGDIVITEGAPTDFAPGAGQTLRLTLPSGWQFKTSGASVSFLNSRDIASAVIAVTTSNLTVTLSVSTNTKSDQLVIHGLQVQPLDGNADPNVGYILNLSSDSGTAVIAGIFPDLSTFGLLNTIPGTPRALQLTTQPSTTAVAGAAFTRQPTVMTFDQFGNQCYEDVTTVVSATRFTGTGTLLGTTTLTVVGGECSFSDLNHIVANTISILFSATNQASVTSDPMVILPAVANRLVFTTQPGAAVSGSPFGTQPTLKSQDQFGNDSTSGFSGTQNVTLSLTSGTGSLLGAASQDIGTNAGNGVVTFTNLEIDAAGFNKQLTASSAGFSDALSSLFPVSGTGFSGLLVLVPGETFAPGTPTGKTGSPVTQAAGAAFSVTVNAVDPTYNLINTVTDVVNIISSDNTAILPANAALVNGTATFSVTLTNLGGVTVTASDVTDNTKTPGSSPVIQVVGAPARLTLQTQPSGTASAGTIFAQQPVIRVEDASGNLISADNGRVITAARNTGTGTLQGSLTARTVNGLATFTNLSYNVAETVTIQFSTSGLTNTVSDPVVVSAGAADRLVFSTQPGGLSRVGSPLGVQPVVRARDAYGNPSTSGLPASLPLVVTLTSGSGALAGTLTLDIGTAAGNGNATFTNLQCSVGGTNKQLTAAAATLSNAVSSPFNVGGIDLATGGTALSADTTGGAYAALLGPVYYEAASGDVTAGTIILNSPPGFSFDTGGTAPTVLIQRLSGAGGNTNNIDRVASGTAVAITTRTTNQITLTVTNASSGGVTCSMTWTNVRIRPNLGTPLASGNLTGTGTSALAGVVSGSTSLGSLTELAGLATRLVFTTQPSSGTAGAILPTQPVLRSRDQFGNDSISGLSASRVVSLALAAGTGPLLGTINLDIGTSAGNGLVSFTNLEIDSAGTNKQLSAAASGMTNGLSGIFTVGAAAASRLTIQTQPSAAATAGTNFSVQPVIRIEDGFGNVRSNDNTTVVVASRVSGSGILQGITSKTAVNGIVTFTNLSYSVAETITLGFASGTLSGATSSNVVVSPAAASRLTIQTQPPASAIAGTAFNQQPVIRIEDQFGNLRNADNSTVVSATRSAGAGTLQGTINRTAVNGIVSFTDLAHNVATNITIGFSSGTLVGATSSSIAVSPAASNRLTIQTQPSASAVAGVAFAQQPVIRIEDSFGNLIASDSATVVTASRNGGSGALQGTTGMGAVNGVVTFTNLSHSLATNITIGFAAGSLTPATSSTVVVNAGAFSKLQLLVPGETAVPGTATGKSGTPTAQTGGLAFSLTVNAVDANWNRITNVTDTIAISSSDANAVLPANAALVAGTKSFSLNLKTAPSQTVTASDVTQPARTANTSLAITVNAAAAARLTIQTQPSATATAGVAFSQQPVIRIEDQFGNLRTTDNSTVVTATRLTGAGTLQGTTALTAVGGLVTFTNLAHNLATNITIQFTSGVLTNVTSSTVAVSAAAADHLTLQTQPSTTATAGVVFAQQPVIRIEDAFGNLRSGDSSAVTATRNLGTGVLQGTTTVVAGGGLASFGNLSYNVAETISLNFGSGSLAGASSGNIVVSPAAASRLSIQRQPSPSASAGVPFAQQPIVRVEDTFGNLRSSDNSTAVSAARSAGSGVLQGTINVTAVNGVITFSNLSHNVATNITISFSSGALTGTNSNLIAVSPAGATRLVFTAQPGSATAGAPFGNQPSIKTQDQFGNDSKVGLGGNVPASIALTSGTGPLTGTTTADIGTNGVGSFINLEIDSTGTNKQLTVSAAGLSNALSSVFSVSPAVADHLSVLTQPSSNAVAGTVFSQQPAVRVEDAYGNLRSSDNSTMVSVGVASGSSAILGTTNLKAINGVISFTNLAYNVAENITLGFSSGTLGGATSGTVTVSPAAASRLTIQTQPSASATAGTAFNQQPVIRIEDQFGNLRNADNSTVVSAARSAGAGTLQGTTNRTAVNGIVSFTDLAHNVATNITIGFSSGILVGATSSSITVSPAAANRLTIQTQPSASAIAGVAFAQQPVIRIEDSFGNLIASDSATVVTASRNGGSGALQGTTGMGAVNGVVTFTNLSHNLATNITIGFAAGSLTPATSSTVVVNAGAFSKLQLLVPGETAVPGTATGKSGTPTAQTGGVAFSLTVNAVDANWNRITNVTDTIGISSSDANAVLPANAALVAGTKSFSLTLKTVPSQMATASDVTQPAKTANVSAAITVNAAAAARLTIQTQPSATATAGVAFSQQPVIRIEDQFGNLRTTDNNSVVTATRLTGAGTLQGTTALTAVGGLVTFTNLAHNLATNITIQFTSGVLTNVTSSTVAVSAAAADHLTLQTQPSITATAGVVFAQQPVIRIEDAFGNLRSGDSSTAVTATRNLGTGVLQGTTTVVAGGGLASFGNLSYNVAETISLNFGSGPLAGASSGNIVVSPAAASRLSIQRQPSPSASAGVPFAQQPIVRVEDTFGNLRSSDNSTVVSAARSAGSGILQGTTNVTAVNGVITFSNLSHNVATNITIGFAGGALIGTVSDPIAISPAAATRLIFTAQPGSATAGAPFGNQPSIKTQDQFGNDSKVGLGGNVPASIALTSGAGPLTGTITADIGTNAGNGVGSFTNLEIDSTGTNKQLTVSASGLSNALSSVFSVSPAVADHLSVLMQPSSNAVAGTVFAQQPAVRVEDAYGNLCSSDNSTMASVGVASGSSAIVGTTNLKAVNGVISFTNLSYNVAENITLGFSSGSLGGATSGTVTVSPAAASRLTIQTQPSATATAGTAFNQQPVIRIEDQFGNLRNADNSTVVSATRSSGAGTLQGTTNRTAVNGIVSFTDLAHNVATNITIGFSSGILVGATSSSITVSPAAANRLTIQTQPSASAVAGVAFAQQPVIRIEDSFGNLIASDSATVVTASRNGGSGTLQGTTGVGAVNGVVTFTNLSHNLATNITIGFTSPGVTTVTSASVSVSPGPTDHLTIQTQPSANATAGVAFAPQPVIRIEDQFGNLRASDNSTVVSASRASGSGTLQGATNMTASGGLVTFTNLSHTVATNITVQFASAGLPGGGAISGLIMVSPASAAKLTIKNQPSSTAIAGIAFAQQPALSIEDQFGNLRSGDSSTVVTAARSAGSGTLQGTLDTVAVNGVVTFVNLSHHVATNITIAFTSSNLTGTTSATISIGAASASRLSIQTQPSSSATAGAVFGQQPVIRIEDSFGNLVGSDNSSAVSAAIASGSSTIQGASVAVAQSGLASFTNLSYTVAETIQLGFSSGTLTPATSSNVVVGPGTANRLTIQRQPAATATAGMPFAPQPLIRIEDQYGNLRNTDNTTVVTATRAAGSGTLQGIASMAAVGGTVTFTNLAHNVATNITIQFASSNLVSATSTSIAVGPGAATRLGLQTQPSASATAGVVFGQQPIVRIEDAFGNCVTGDNSHVVNAIRNNGSGVLQGTTIVTVVSGLAAYTDLAHNVATNISIDFSSAGLAGITSSNILVAPATFSKLQLLVPGENPAPGTGSGKTGTPASQVAGTAFNAAINAVDAFWNVVPGATDTIHLSSSDANAILPANAALTAGTRTLSATLKTAGNVTLTVTDVTQPSISSSTSSTIPVTAGSFAKLRLLMPGESASPGSPTGKTGTPSSQTAGSPLSVTVTAVDANWNVISSINDTIGITSSDPNANLPGNTALISGTGVLSLTFKTVGSRTVTASDITDATKAAGVGSSTTVNAGPFTKLQLLLPGESSVPGTATGKAGAPIAQTVAGAFSVTVNSVDANWNLVNSVSDAVRITSSDTSATMPPNAQLVAGTVPFTVALNTAGTATVTATDVSASGKAASVSPVVTVNSANYTAATGGNPISADTANGAAVNLSGPTYSENANGNVGAGTIVLKAPAGFSFATTGAAPAIVVNRLTGSGSSANNINGVTSGTLVPMTSVTSTQLVFTVTSSSASGITCGLVWTNVRVRAIAGTPLASGNLTVGGTASLLTVFTNSNFGSLIQVPGAANKLAVQTQPSATATAGVPFIQQPVIRILDQFGNLCSSNNGIVITAARNLGAGTLQGAASQASSSGVAVFTNLSHNVATNITIDFSSSGLSNTTSAVVAVGPAAATILAFTTQPGNATAGSAFGVQPVVRSQDAFGNNSTLGLPASLNLSMALNSGTGPLQGATLVDIGTLAANGAAVFNNLRLDVAGTNRQLTATCAGLSPIVSSTFTVNTAAASRLAIKTQPSAGATAGIAFAQQPIIRIEDSLGNLRSGDNSTVVNVIRGTGTGALQGATSVVAAGGIVTFANLSYTLAETINLTFNSASLTGIVSANVVVSPSAATKLTLSTQPSSTATAGSAFVQQPVVRIEDLYGNLRTTDNTTVITATRGTGTGVLVGTTSLSASGGIGVFTDLSYPVAEPISISFAASGLSNASSATIVITPGAFSKLLVLAPGESLAPATTNGKSGTPLVQSPDSPFTITVNAVDDYWNIINNSTDLVSISSSDLLATLPGNARLIGGTRQFSLTPSRTGTNVITAADLSAPEKPLATSSGIPVLARYTSATGGQSISADTTGGLFAGLTGPAYSENSSGEAGPGTIILNTPPGFIFDTSTAPTVRIDRIGGSALDSKNINGVTSGTSAALSSITSTQLTFIVSSASASGNFCRLTWQSVRVRPAAGTPLALGRLTKSGTSTMAGVTNGVSNLGTLREITGLANLLAMETQPSVTATAGVAFAQQPVIRVKDQFGNLLTALNGNADNSTVVTASRGLGSGTLQGQTSAVSSDGRVSFTNLMHATAINISLLFAGPGLLSTNSTIIAVNPAAASQLTFVTQPGTGSVGSLLSPQPVICAADPYGNKSMSGIGPSMMLHLVLSSGSGSLLGTTTQDLGSAANGVVNFSDLVIDSAGTNKQLTVSAAGFASASSSPFSVTKGTQAIAFAPLTDRTYGDSSFGLSASSSSGLPIQFTVVSGPATLLGTVVSISGAGVVTIRAEQPGDSNWNAATPVNQSFQVSKAILTVRGNDTNRLYGAVNPSFTASYSGFVNGETEAVLHGAPGLASTAVVTSPVAGNPYSISVGQATLNADNYNFVFADGQLTITPASSTTVVSTFTNPSPTGSNVTFTASVTPVGPGSGVPAGTVAFKADGLALGVPASLLNGVATISNVVLAHGTHAITAEYAGDGNFLGSTNGGQLALVVNRPPAARLASYSRLMNSSLQIVITDLLTNYTSDLDGDVITLLQVGPGTNGATISIAGNSIWYNPSPTDPNRNTTDYFYYAVNDGFVGGVATNFIQIGISGPDPASNPPMLEPIVVLADHVVVRFRGVQSCLYHIERQGALGGGWTDLGQVATDASGTAAFTDDAPLQGQAFYRVVWHDSSL